MATALIRYETIDGEQIDQIMEGREPDPPEGWHEGDADLEPEAARDETDSAGDRTSVGGPAEQH